jgi:hypothetical protein
MSEFLFYYHPVEPSTWFYLSSLLTIGLFFKFSRLWSVRNLDLALLIMLGPGLLFVHYGRQADERPSRAETAGMNAAGLEVGREAQPQNEWLDEVGASGEESSIGGPSGTESTLAPRVEIPGEQFPSGPLNVPSSAATGSGPDVSPSVAEAVDGDIADIADIDDSADLLTRGQRVQKYGYVWLFFTGILVVVRLLADPTMVRRPLLEPNLSAGGLTFIGCSLFVFLMANVVSRPADDLAPSDTTQLQKDVATADGDPVVAAEPGYALLARLPGVAKKILVVLAHLAIVIGMVLIGYRHFDNMLMGVGAASLYLMLPYTVLMTSEIKHALPAACVVWAVLCYRRPMAAGAFLGLAGGMSYYPLFLLPLWFSFYWPRGLWRFSVGVGSTLVLLLFVLFSSTDVIQNIRLMFGLMSPAMGNLRGVWDESLGGWNIYYRIPMLAAFVALASSMALWPAQKNLGTLLSCSGAVMVATQFWHGYGGGLYMAWYLPMLLLTIFRPNLEDRVALTVLAEGWLPRRLIPLTSGRAA